MEIVPLFGIMFYWYFCQNKFLKYEGVVCIYKVILLIGNFAVI
jgi:hypothetical protein